MPWADCTSASAVTRCPLTCSALLPHCDEMLPCCLLLLLPAHTCTVNPAPLLLTLLLLQQHPLLQRRIRLGPPLHRRNHLPHRGGAPLHRQQGSGSARNHAAQPAPPGGHRWSCRR